MDSNAEDDHAGSGGAITDDEVAGSSFRPATDDDIDGMVAVFQAAFPRWPLVEVDVSASDHLRWKMQSHERVENTHLLMLLDDTVVGAMVQLGRTVLVGGEPLVAQSTADAALDPQLQGTGLTRVGKPHFDAITEGLFDLSLNTESNHPSLRAIAAARGTSAAFGNPLRTLVAGLTLRTQFGIRWRANRWTSLPRTAVEVTRQAGQRVRPAQSELTVEAVEQFDQNIDTLWAEVAPHFSLIGVRDSAFLNWRYADRRGGDSLILVASEGDTTVGYLVLRWTRRSAVIADILSQPSRPEIVSRLVSEASQQASSHGAAVISCLLPERHPYRDAVLDNGFLDIGRKTNVRYEHLNVSAETLTFLEEPDANVHITLGDFDFI